MKVRIQEAVIDQRVVMDIQDEPDVEKDGVKIKPLMVTVAWNWIATEDSVQADTGLAIFRIRVTFVGRRRSLDGDSLGKQATITFMWGDDDFPQGELSKWIEENQPYTTGALVPAALRWDEL